VTPGELRAELEAGRVRSAYLVAGEEPLLRDEALALLTRHVLGDATREFDFDRLDGARIAPGPLADALHALPVLAARRLVVLREPAGRTAGAKALCDAIAELLGAGIDPNVLVVCQARADRRERWVRAFAEPNAVVACDRPRRARDAQAFVKDEAERQGVSIETGAAQLLVERIGPELLMLRQEIAKASLLAGPGARVTRAHVAASAADVAEEPIWDLTDAIGEGRTGEALAVLGAAAARCPARPSSAASSASRPAATLPAAWCAAWSPSTTPTRP